MVAIKGVFAIVTAEFPFFPLFFLSRGAEPRIYTDPFVTSGTPHPKQVLVPQASLQFTFYQIGEQSLGAHNQYCSKEMYFQLQKRETRKSTLLYGRTHPTKKNIRENEGEKNVAAEKVKTSRIKAKGGVCADTMLFSHSFVSLFFCNNI